MDDNKFNVLTTTCGTPGVSLGRLAMMLWDSWDLTSSPVPIQYMAPEIFRKSGHGFKVDVWAIGVIA
jgi:calcium/calmodulin-dependent protein kinase I